jgi:molybdenum cofactor synthesis domain-containing protein
MSAASRKTARIVVIGDEILSGKVVDTNSPWLLGRLRALGVRCEGVTVVPDTLDRIAAAVAEASATADEVFTTGGVGPTHDDRTMEGIAQAFGEGLVQDPTLTDLIENHWPGPATEVRLRMARIPAGASVEMIGRFPQVRRGNVWVFPGVPSLLRRRFELLEERFAQPRRACAAVVTLGPESTLATTLEAVDEAFPAVDLGSYPQWDEQRTVRITLEADADEDVQAATDALVAALRQVVSVDRCFHPEDAGPG